MKIAFQSFGIELEDYATNNLPEGIFSDDWFAPYLQYAIDHSLLDTGDIDLNKGMTREDFSEVVYRLIQQQEAL